MKIKTILSLSSLLFVAGATYAGGSCCSMMKSGDGSSEKQSLSPIGMDVVETAMGSDQFSTLVAAIQAAGLAETLQTAENITVFAPTNAAFEALPDGTVEMLLKPENKEILVGILTYHVLPMMVPAGNVTAGSVETMEGSSVEITVEDGTVMIGGATVTATDIEASNGVIHEIDGVLLPPDLEL